MKIGMRSVNCGCSYVGSPRSVPPVCFSTFATTLAATASISSSVIVRSVGCKVSQIAADLRPSRPSRLRRRRRRRSLTKALSAPRRCRIWSALTEASTTKAKSRWTGWKAEIFKDGRALPPFCFGCGTWSGKTSNAAAGPRSSRRRRTFDALRRNRLRRPCRPQGAGASRVMQVGVGTDLELSTGAPTAAAPRARLLWHRKRCCHSGRHANGAGRYCRAAHRPRPRLGPSVCRHGRRADLEETGVDSRDLRSFRRGQQVQQTEGRITSRSALIGLARRISSVTPP